MPTIKLSKFLGEAPRVAGELLPDTVAQYAMNCKLYSGNLQAFPLPVNVETLTRSGTIKSIFPMDDGAGGTDWLHWTTHVDVAVSQLQSDTTQRVYFTGDGAPKQTNYSLATTGAGDFPIATRPLGLPAPSAAAAATAAASTAIATTYRSRTSNIAAVTLASAPLFGIGTVVTVTGLGGTGYNLSNVTVTDISGSVIYYNCPGANEGSTADAAGSCAFAGLALLRNYVYTWYTDWEEESSPSPATTDVAAYDGQKVTVASLPSTAPTGYSGVVTHKRIYRTATSGAGVLYFFVAEVTLATTSYDDTLTDLDLGEELPSVTYDMPNSGMKGIVNLANGLLAGYFDNQLCFSEPDKPWAWPIEYRKTVSGTVMGIAPLGTSLVVVTDRYPSLVSGQHPDVMTVTRLDVAYPCVAERSVVNVGYGVLYACPDGLALISTAGNDLATRLVHYRDTWREQVMPETIAGAYYNGKYFGSHDTAGFIFEKDDKVGGIYTRVNFQFTAAHYSFSDGYLYYVDTIDTQQVKRWDDPDGAAGTFDWKSKVFRPPMPTNFGAFRIIADFTVDGSGVVDENNARSAYNMSLSDDEISGRFNDMEVNYYEINGNELRDMLGGGSAVTFQMYVDGLLVFQRSVVDDAIYRLPAGFLSDRYEFRVSSTLRVREIQVGETPYELREI